MCVYIYNHTVRFKTDAWAHFFALPADGAIVPPSDLYLADVPKRGMVAELKQHTRTHARTHTYIHIHTQISKGDHTLCTI